MERLQVVKGLEVLVSHEIMLAFPGFSRPTYTPVPDEVFDQLLPDLSKPELKVLLYVIRHTFGWNKDADAISISQFADGITARDGRLIDRGTGLPRSSVRTATKSLVNKGILTVRQVRSETGDYDSNVYALRFREVGQPSAYLLPNPDRGVDQLSANPMPVAGLPVGQPLALQETTSQEKAKQDSSSRKSAVHAVDEPPLDPLAAFRAMTPEQRLVAFERQQQELRQLQRMNGRQS